MWLDIAEEFASLQSAACGSPSRRAYRPQRSCGRVAEGGGLLNRYRVVKPYRGFESLRLRQSRTELRTPLAADFTPIPRRACSTRRWARAAYPDFQQLRLEAGGPNHQTSPKAVGPPG